MKSFTLNWLSPSHLGIPAASRWAACAGVLLLCAGTAPAQSPAVVADADGDGLVLAQEKLLGTSPTLADSDGDGISDLEELARRSSPISTTSVPDYSKQFSIGMTIHAELDGLHALTCVFMADTDLRSKQLQLGFLGGGRVAELSNEYVAAHSTVNFYPSVTLNGCVAVIDTLVDPNWVQLLGEFEVYAKGAEAGGGVGFDIIHLLSIAGVPVYAMPMPHPLGQVVIAYGGLIEGRGTIYVPLFPTPGTTGTASGTGASGVTGGSGGSGSGGGTAAAVMVPATWSPGEVCFQRSSFVGASAAMVTNEIIAAECLSGWDGFCPPTCTSTVGSTYHSVDPLVLLGG